MKFSYAILTAFIVTVIIEVYGISRLGDGINSTGAGLLFLSLSPVVLAVFTILGYFLPLMVNGKILWLRLLLFVTVSLLIMCRIIIYITD